MQWNDFENDWTLLTLSARSRHSGSFCAWAPAFARTDPEPWPGPVPVIVTCAVPFALAFTALVAVTVNVPLVPPAVNSPVLLIVAPGALVLHATCGSDVPRTMAENCCVPPATTVACSGVTLTATLHVPPSREVRADGSPV